MARRRGSKPSRQARREQRARSERAQQHGLPAVEPPRAPPRSAASARSARAAAAGKARRGVAVASDAAPEAEAGRRDGAQRRPPTRSRRVARLPLSTWLALGVATALVVLFAVLTLRGGSRPAPAPASTLPASGVDPVPERADEVARPPLAPSAMLGLDPAVPGTPEVTEPLPPLLAIEPGTPSPPRSPGDELRPSLPVSPPDRSAAPLLPPTPAPSPPPVTPAPSPPPVAPAPSPPPVAPAPSPPAVPLPVVPRADPPAPRPGPQPGSDNPY